MGAVQPDRRARQELAPGRCEGTGAGGSHPEQADRPVRPPAFRLTEGPAETRDFFMYFIEKNRLFLFTTEGAMVLIIHAISTN